MRFRVVGIFLFVLGIFFSPISAQAQDGNWEYALVLPLWGAGLDGEVAARGHTVEVDQSFGDVLSNMEFGFAGALRAHKDRWAVTGEFLYVGLGATPTLPGGNSVEVDVDQWLISGDMGYQLGTNFEVLGGARIVSLQNKLQFKGPLGVEVEADKTWVDPVVGFRYAPVLGENLQLWTRFDIGGFDVGSDLTWQLNANVVWLFSDRTALSIGYRVLDMKYDDGEGDEGFVYDATSHGPMLGLVVTF